MILILLIIKAVREFIDIWENKIKNSWKTKMSEVFEECTVFFVHDGH